MYLKLDEYARPIVGSNGNYPDPWLHRRREAEHCKKVPRAKTD